MKLNPASLIKIKRFFKTWNETIGFLISFFLFLFSPVFVRLFDPYAGSFDFGVVQVAIISLLLFQWSGIAAWFTFRFNFPKLFEWFDRDMETMLNANIGDIIFTREMKKAYLCFTIYFLYFIFMVAINFAFISMSIGYN